MKTLTISAPRDFSRPALDARSVANILSQLGIAGTVSDHIHISATGQQLQGAVVRITDPVVSEWKRTQLYERCREIFGPDCRRHFLHESDENVNVVWSDLEA